MTWINGKIGLSDTLVRFNNALGKQFLHNRMIQNSIAIDIDDNVVRIIIAQSHHIALSKKAQDLL